MEEPDEPVAPRARAEQVPGRRRSRRTSRSSASLWHCTIIVLVCTRATTDPLLTAGTAGSISSQRRRPTQKERAMAFELPALPYDFDALEPTIDAKTMEIHHDKHHQAYVTNLNAALEGTEWADRSIEDVITNLDADPGGQARRGAQQRRRPLQPLALLADHAAARRRRPLRRARGGDQRHLRRSRPAQGADQRRRRQAFRLGLDLARRRRRRALGRLDAEPGQPADGREDRRSSASTSGSTPTTSSTRTAGPTTSRPGGTSSTGTRSPGVSRPRAASSPTRASPAVDKPTAARTSE